MLGQLDPRIEGTNQAILDDTGHGHRPTKSNKIGLYRRCDCAVRQLKRRQWRFARDLLVWCPTFSASMIDSRISHTASPAPLFVSIRIARWESTIKGRNKELSRIETLPIVATLPVRQEGDLALCGCHLPENPL
jgi:hypothetical protein